MRGTVLSWKQAITQGYEPRQYEYLPGPLPNDIFDAILDFKIWAKVPGINGYFTISDTGKKIQLSVYLSASRTYYIGKHSIDFYRCPVGCLYQLQIGRTGKGKTVLLDLIAI
ncbi:hypothetical protein [Paraflavitalea pollutisoli]|uniref:hypothetical protein n=1 Tax=Paraflavitalea pollutisoli TaxID=3034143 RepID=UPI0023ED6127|nr:hypothetical protein [Paraflavitalea sp. H1-2-19X]